MAIRRFLAMTAAEIQGNSTFPGAIGWMACQFSPWSQGLSNLPKTLPQDSLLILNDFAPMDGHDPSMVGVQLQQCVDSLKCSGLLLDFQRPVTGQMVELASLLVSLLPCPVAVSEPYAKEFPCPVFLPPLPHHVPLKEYIAPWQDREIWLDMAPDGEVITLTEEGARIAPLSPGEALPTGHWNESLHCHYQIALPENAAAFTLWRTREDLEDLAEEAERLGIATVVGLYQEYAKTALD